jgi:CRP/FNR family transcriptional regulator, cyclic AMP receptor protein
MAPTTALVGYLAAGLVFASFCTKRMVPLRSIAFISYSYLGGLWPILILHVALLPLNILRLRQEVSQERPAI